MLTPLRDHLDPRDWLRPWRDPPAFFVPGCFCCASAGGTYFYCAGNALVGSGQQQNDMYTIDTWTSKTAMPSPGRHDAGAAAVGGLGYVFGGVDPSAVLLQQNDSYDPKGDSWTTKTSLPSPGRRRNAGTADPDTGSGLVYSIGGTDNTGAVYNKDNDVYDPSGDNWVSKTDVTTGRFALGAFCISSFVYAVGGVTSTSFNDTINQRYDPDAETWSSKTAITSGRGFPGSFQIASVGYVAAGGGPSGLTTTTQAYSPGPNTWASSGTIPSPARDEVASGASAASAAGYITGGASATSARIRDHEEFASGSWTSRADASTPARFYGAAMFI